MKILWYFKSVLWHLQPSLFNWRLQSHFYGSKMVGSDQILVFPHLNNSFNLKMAIRWLENRILLIIFMKISLVGNFQPSLRDLVVFSSVKHCKLLFWQLKDSSSCQESLRKLKIKKMVVFFLTSKFPHFMIAQWQKSDKKRENLCTSQPSLKHQTIF